jgi:biotin carboxylase
MWRLRACTPSLWPRVHWAAAGVQACQDAGADAVHPGYGFLSESKDFVAAVEGAGMQWLGPGAKTISEFALKHVAKKIATDAGVPIVEGSPLVTTLDGVHGTCASAPMRSCRCAFHASI